MNYYLALICYLAALNVDAAGTIHPDVEATLLNAAVGLALAIPVRWISRFFDVLLARE